MIILDESGLAAGPYANLRDDTGDPTLEVTLEQYSLGLTLHDMDGPSCLATFDAIVSDDVVVRAGRTAADTLTIQTLATEDGGDQVWSVVANLPATGISDEIAISLATDGTDVRVFYYDAAAGQIEYFENNAKGVGNAGTWGATALCMAVPYVVGLAATTLTRVHYLCAAGAYDNRQFRVAIDNAGWFATSSEIWWQLPIDSFDAVVGPQVDDGAAATNDILVFATDLPHIIGRKIENGELIYTITQVQGIAIIRYQNGRWSDHYTFDVVDEAPAFPSRHDVRVSTSGDLLFVTYYREDGTETYSHTSISLSRSKDGIRWELPYLLTDALGDANILLKRGNHAYLLNSWKCYRSPSVGYTGDAQNTQDITDYVVARTVTSGDVKRLELTLANPEQVLDVLGLFDTDMSLQVRLKDGYWLSGTETTVQTMLADVDVLGGDERLPTDHIMLAARDLLGRMNALQADQINEWESQRVTGDNFDQASDSVYSGMRHTATLEGHWKTESNELYIVPKEALALAWHTDIPDAYNGSCQAGIKVAATDSDDYAGLIFRCHDKRNYMSVRYVAEQDRIILYRVQDNDEDVLTKTGYLGWTYDTWYFIKVRFRYGYIWVYSGTDGVTWILQIAAPVNGVADGTAWTWASFAAKGIPNLTGKMGYVAHGYSDEEDTYVEPPPNRPPPTGEWPDTVDLGCRIIATDGGVIVTDNIGNNPPVWYAINDGLDDLMCYDVKRDPWNWWTMPIEGDKILWVSTRTGVWKMVGFPTGTWTQVISEADIYAFTGWTPDWPNYLRYGRLAFSIEVENRFAYVVNVPKDVGMPYNYTDQITVFVVDNGVIQNFKLLDDSYYAVAFSAVMFSPHSAGLTIWAVSNREPFHVSRKRQRVWRTEDGGGTWTLIEALGIRALHTSLSIPYIDADSNDDYVFWGRGGGVATGAGQYRLSENASQGSPTFGDLPGGTGAWSKIGTGMHPDNIFLLYGYMTGVESKWSNDRGASWNNLPMAADNYNVFASFADWDWQLGQIISVLVGTAGGLMLYWESGDGAWTVKTGNLGALGVAWISAVDRDSMGTA